MAEARRQGDVSDSDDDDLFLSASEGEDEGVEIEASTNVDSAAPAKELPAVEQNVDISLLKEDETQKTAASLKEDSVPEQETVEATVEVAKSVPEEEPPISHSDNAIDKKSSSSTEVITKQEISEVAEEMASCSPPKSVSEGESSSKELGWDDFHVDAEEQEDDDTGDGWDNWDAPDADNEDSEVAESEEKVEKHDNEPSNDWFSEQMNVFDKKEEAASEKRRNAKPKGSLWEWTGINEVVSAVGEGFSNVVENSLGLPSAEDMARITAEEEREQKESKREQKTPEESTQSQTGPQGGAFGGMFSGFVTGGLDVLETLGKKTFETVTVNDEERSGHGRRFVFQPEGPAKLSEILKERMAGEEEQHSDQSLAGYGSTSSEKFQGICFQREFDQDEGSVHLEGLQLISANYARQQMKSNSSNSFFESILRSLNVEDSDTCSTSSFESDLRGILNDVGLPYKAPNLIAANRDLISLMESPMESADEIYKSAITVLAKFTAQSMQVFHKLSQLMLIADEFPPQESLIELAQLFCRRINFFAQQIVQLLNSCQSSDKVDEMVTTVFFEASNAHSHLRKAAECFRAFY